MTLRRITVILLAAYALLTFYPALSIFTGVAPSRLMTPLTTLVGFTFALLHAGQREGWLRALRLLALVFAIALLFESVGVATGLIYGPYHYTLKLGPLFLGLVPYLIPVAWFMMSYPSFVIADRFVPMTWGRWPRLLAVAASGGMAMTAWDLVMDPIMVAGGHWVWDVAGAYHGIPLQNFFGWWLTAFATYGLYQLLFTRPAGVPEDKFDRLAVLGYLVTALGITLAALFSAYGELTLIGLFAMLPWALMGWIGRAVGKPGS